MCIYRDPVQLYYYYLVLCLGKHTYCSWHYGALDALSSVLCTLFGINTQIMYVLDYLELCIGT